VGPTPGDLVEFDHGKLGFPGSSHGIFKGFDEILRVIFMGFNGIISHMLHVSNI